MNFGNWLGLNGIATLAASTAGVVITWMYCSSNRRKSKEKKLMINKARTIMLRLDRIDVAFCYDPIYRFVKHKICAAIEALDNDDHNKASDHFADALLLTGNNEELLKLMGRNLPEKIVKSIKNKCENIIRNDCEYQE